MIGFSWKIFRLRLDSLSGNWKNPSWFYNSNSHGLASKWRRFLFFLHKLIMKIVWCFFAFQVEWSFLLISSKTFPYYCWRSSETHLERSDKWIKCANISSFWIKKVLCRKFWLSARSFFYIFFDVHITIRVNFISTNLRTTNNAQSSESNCKK